MLGERIVPQSEVIRAIMSGYSPCCGPSHQDRQAEQRKRSRDDREAQTEQPDHLGVLRPVRDVAER